MRSLPVRVADILLGWRSWTSGAVSVGQETSFSWRRVRRASGNRLQIGDRSIVHANISFEDRGGDILIEFDSKPIQNLYDFTYALRSKKPGDEVLVKVLRGNETISATVLLTKRVE